MLSIGPGSSYLLDKSSATAASLGPAPLSSMVPVWVLEEAAAEHCLYAGEHYWGTLGLHCGHWVSPVCGSTSTHTQKAGSEDRNVPVTPRSGLRSTGSSQPACLQGQHILGGLLTKLLAQSIRKEGGVGGHPGHTRTSDLAYQDPVGNHRAASPGLPRAGSGKGPSFETPTSRPHSWRPTSLQQCKMKC